MANLQKIRQIAKERGLKLKSMCSAIDLTEQGLQKIITKNVTSTDTLEKIALYLNVPVSVFFDDYPTPTAQANGEGSVAIAGNNNVTIPHEVLVMLSDKDKQLREKDELIAKLTNKLLSL